MSPRDRLGMSPIEAGLAWLLAAAVGGVSGIVSLLLCHYLLTFGGGDSADKHGISKVDATRIGGVAIVAYMTLHLAYQTQLGAISIGLDQFLPIGLALSYFLIGFYEDMRGTLGSKTRFCAMIALAIAGLLLIPGLVLQSVEIMVVDWFLSAPITALLFTATCIAFIPNAFNTADGANGLVSGVTVIALLGIAPAAPESLALFLRACAVGCVVFLIFNLISGRFFLGDGGAYFLGALCGIALITVANTADVSTWWLLSLVFYPVADLLWSMVRRTWAGGSPLKPDNKHLHNLIFTLLDDGSRSSYAANTTTGVGIALLFAGGPLMLQSYVIDDLSSGTWGWLVLAQWLVYGLTWQWANRRICLLPQD